MAHLSSVSFNFLKITYALVNDTIYAVVEAFKQDTKGISRHLKDCFADGYRIEDSSKKLLNNLNEKVSKWQFLQLSFAKVFVKVLDFIDETKNSLDDRCYPY